MNEAKYRHDHVIPHLRSWGFDVQHHEDRIYPDIPDLSFACESAVDGWIELKYSPKGLPKGRAKFWPASLTQGQVDWLTRRARAGSAWCYIWWGSPDEHLIMQIMYATTMMLGRSASDARVWVNKYPGAMSEGTAEKLAARFSRTLRSGIY